MMTLGDMLGAAKRSAADFERWAAAADPALAVAAKAAAQAQGMPLGGYLRSAVADFSRFADEEAWAQLSRAVRDDDDPGMACLKTMLRWHTAATAGTGNAFAPLEEERS